MPDKDMTERFAATMFGDAFDEGFMASIWTLPDRDIVYAKSVSEFVDLSAERAESKQVYFGTGLVKHPPDRKTESGGKPRPNADEIAAMTSVWCDIDILGDGGTEAHQKKFLPRNLDEATSLLNRVGPTPTVVVNSGFGLHAYWMFPETWVIDEDASRERTKLLWERWHATVKAAARASGHEVDSTFDLARVLRVPGTYNHKSEPPRPVVMTDIGEIGRRWLMDDLETYMVAEELVKTSRTVVVEIGHLVLHETAEPPAEQLAVLLQDPDFASTWKKERDSELPSPSEYDLAIASFCAHAAFTDQQIANTLIAWRRKHGQPSKIRQDYYQRTLAKARGSDAHKQAIADLTGGDLPPVGTPINDRERTNVIDKLRKALGVNIERFIKMGRENASFAIVLKDGTDISLGVARQVLSQEAVRAKIFDAIGVVIRTMKQPAWHGVVETLYRIVEIEENPEADRSGTLMAYMNAYLPAAIIYRNDEWKRAVAQNNPFIRDGQLHIHAMTVRNYITKTIGDKVTREQLYDMLRLSGFTATPITVRIDGGSPMCRSYWVGPDLTKQIAGSANGDDEDDSKPVEAEQVADA